MTAFASLALFLFPSLIKLYLSEPTSFHTCVFPILSASGGNQPKCERVAAWVVSCWPGSTDIYTFPPYRKGQNRAKI